MIHNSENQYLVFESHQKLTKSHKVFSMPKFFSFSWVHLNSVLWTSMDIHDRLHRYGCFHNHMHYGSTTGIMWPLSNVVRGPGLSATPAACSEAFTAVLQGQVSILIITVVEHESCHGTEPTAKSLKNYGKDTKVSSERMMTDINLQWTFPKEELRPHVINMFIFYSCLSEVPEHNLWLYRYLILPTRFEVKHSRRAPFIRTPALSGHEVSISLRENIWNAFLPMHEAVPF